MLSADEGEIDMKKFLARTPARRRTFIPLPDDVEGIITLDSTWIAGLRRTVNVDTRARRSARSFARG